MKRRQLLQLSAAMLASPSLTLAAESGSVATPKASSVLPLIQRPIPHSGEMLPVIGMGTSITFDTPGDAENLAILKEVMSAFFVSGGTIVDTSPMYGEAEARVGDVLKQLPEQKKLFAATKVWTTGKEGGIAQMQTSAKRMNVDTFDLIAVHNLQDWKTHLETLEQWKKEGKVRHTGITTSHGRNHAELLNIMRTRDIDFIQISYNIDDRTAEQELLPLAQDRGIATMINRPYQRGSLFGRSRGKDLPEVAADIDCDSWGQFYLKFILGHPAVTSVIPATSNLSHMVDNMKANFGRLPDEQERLEMLRVFDSL